MDFKCPFTAEQIGSLLNLGFSSDSIISAFSPNCKKDGQALAILKIYREWQKQDAIDFLRLTNETVQKMQGEFLQGKPDNQKRFELSENTGEVLEDGKRPWSNKKLEGEILVQSYKRLKMYKKAEAVEDCGTLLQFKECPQGHERYLDLANFCRQRLCPMCQWRKSLVNVKQLRTICHTAATRQDNLRWLFLTLTIKNVKAEGLTEGINVLLEGWNRFSQLAKIRKAVTGYYRSLEVTYSKKRNDFHPHIHVLLAVPADYFDRKSDKYLKKSDIRKMWQNSCRLDYTPIAEVEACYDKNSTEETKVLQEKGISEGTLDPAILEASKYVVKTSDILQKNPEKTDFIVAALERSLKGRRLSAYGGLLKKIYQELGMKSADDADADLVHTDETPAHCTCSVCGSDFNTHLYKWIPEVKKYIG